VIIAVETTIGLGADSRRESRVVRKAARVLTTAGALVLTGIATLQPAEARYAWNHHWHALHGYDRGYNGGGCPAHSYGKYYNCGAYFMPGYGR
jgi:hypothetical protein